MNTFATIAGLAVISMAMPIHSPLFAQSNTGIGALQQVVGTKSENANEEAMPAQDRNAPAVRAEQLRRQARPVVPIRQRIDEGRIVINCQDEAAIRDHMFKAERALARARTRTGTARTEFLGTARAHLRAAQSASAARCTEGLQSSVRKRVDDSGNAIIGKVG